MSVVQISSGKSYAAIEGENLLDAALRANITLTYSCRTGRCGTCTHDSLMEAGQFIATLEKRQGLKVACLDEIAFRSEWITAEQLEAMAQPMLKNGYGQYLMQIVKSQVF